MVSVLILFHRSNLNPRMELFADALVGSGNDVEALCWDRGGSSNVASDVVPVTRIATPGFGMSLWNLFLLPVLYLQFTLTIFRRDADVLLCSHISLLPLSVLVGSITRTPVVYDVVEMYSEGYANREAPFADLIATLLLTIERFSLYAVDGITVIDSAGDVVHDRYSGFTANIEVVYNLPSLKSNPERDKAPGVPTIVYAGLVNERKGVMKLLEAFVAVRGTHDAELLLIGDSVDDTLTRLKRYAVEHDVDQDVEFVGRVEYEHVHDHLEKADIAVAPYQSVPMFELSRWNTRKIPDYMNAALPVIAPSFEGFEQMINETGCGITVDTTDAEALADGIRVLLDDPERARTLGDNGRQATETRYNWELEQQKIVDVITRAAGDD